MSCLEPSVLSVPVGEPKKKSVRRDFLPQCSKFSEIITSKVLGFESKELLEEGSARDCRSFKGQHD